MHSRHHQASKKTFPRTGKKIREKTVLPRSKSSSSSSPSSRTKKESSLRLSILGTPNVRVHASGKLKPIQITPRARNLLKKHPTLVRDFLDILTSVKIRGSAKKGAFAVSVFNPKDESGFHNGLFKLNIKGSNFLVKEVYNPAFPYDPHSQFVLHQKLQTLSPHLKRLNCGVLEYNFAWVGKGTSFLVSPFIQGITLEKWLQEDPSREKSQTYKRFLKSRKVLHENLGLKDVTTRNAMFNTRTGKITFFDLMPPK